MPPRSAKPTPAARMAMKPAHNNRYALGAIGVLSTFVIIFIFYVFVYLRVLNAEGREFHNRAAFEARLMRTETHTGPVRGLFCVRERLTPFQKRVHEFIGQVRMRTAMSRAL